MVTPPTHPLAPGRPPPPHGRPSLPPPPLLHHHHHPPLWTTAAGRRLPSPSASALAGAAAILAPRQADLAVAAAMLATGPLASWSVATCVLPGGFQARALVPDGEEGEGGGGRASKRARVGEE